MPSTEERDLYGVLGVAPDADAAALKTAHRALTRRLHPDVAGPRSAGAMAEVNAAYHVLSDPNRRAEYDRTQAAPVEPEAPAPNADDLDDAWAQATSWADTPAAEPPVAGVDDVPDFGQPPPAAPPRPWGSSTATAAPVGTTPDRPRVSLPRVTARQSTLTTLAVTLMGVAVVVATYFYVAAHPVIGPWLLADSLSWSYISALAAVTALVLGLYAGVMLRFVSSRITVVASWVVPFLVELAVPDSWRSALRFYSLHVPALTLVALLTRLALNAFAARSNPR